MTQGMALRDAWQASQTLKHSHGTQRNSLNFSLLGPLNRLFK